MIAFFIISKLIYTEFVYKFNDAFPYYKSTFN